MIWLQGLQSVLHIGNGGTAEQISGIEDVSRWELAWEIGHTGRDCPHGPCQG